VKVVTAPVKPDGSKLLFSFADYSGDQSESRAYVMDPDGGNRLELAPGLNVLGDCEP
jgi:hypothetical protein